MDDELYDTIHSAVADALAENPRRNRRTTLAEVEQVHKRAESTLAGFPEKTGAP
jgi:hypothetical protein